MPTARTTSPSTTANARRGAGDPLARLASLGSTWGTAAAAGLASTIAAGGAAGTPAWVVGRVARVASAQRRRRSDRGRGRRDCTLTDQFLSPLGDRLRSILLRELQRVIDRGEQAARITARPDDRRRHQDVLRAAEDALAARDGVERRTAGDRAVARGAEPVDVGPRSLVARVAVVLLERRVPRRHEDRERVRIAQRLARRSEIQQHRAAIVADVDVVRLDVAVNEPGVVDQFQSVQDRQENAQQLVLRQRAAPVEQRGEVDAVLEAHHHVCRVVELEHRLHPNDARVVEPRQGPRLLDEALEAPSITVTEVVGPRPDRGIGHARRELDGQVLLDRDPLIEVSVPREIGDPESALPKDPFDYIPMQPRLRRQCVGIGGIGHGGMQSAAVAFRKRRGTRARPASLGPKERAATRPRPARRSHPAAMVFDPLSMRLNRVRRLSRMRDAARSPRSDRIIRRCAPGTARRSRAGRAGALVGRGHAVLAIHVGSALAIGVRHATAIVAGNPRRLAGQDLAAVIELKDALPGHHVRHGPGQEPGFRRDFVGRIQTRLQGGGHRGSRPRCRLRAGQACRRARTRRCARCGREPVPENSDRGPARSAPEPGSPDRTMPSPGRSACRQRPPEPSRSHSSRPRQANQRSTYV